MEATLVKVDDIYRLINDNNSIIGTTDLEYQKAFSDVCFLLSTKNCQAIENGYDLDELVKERFGEAFWHDGDKYLKEGFKKALELLGDKKFSEDDVLNLIKRSREKKPYNFDGKSTEYKFSEDELIHSLQQTEWDVEVEMDAITTDDIYSIIGKPKFDSDGCLILKRK